MAAGDITYAGEFVYMDDVAHPDFNATFGKLTGAVSTAGSVLTAGINASNGSNANLAIGRHVKLSSCPIAAYNGTVWTVATIDLVNSIVTATGPTLGGDPNSFNDNGQVVSIAGSIFSTPQPHGLSTRNLVTFKTSGTMPTISVDGRSAQLQAFTPYWVEVLTTTTFKLRYKGPDHTSMLTVTNPGTGTLQLNPMWQMVPTELHARIWYPTDPGTYPIVFSMQGTGFDGTQASSITGNDYETQQWAKAGFVAVNVEYHGYSLFNNQLRGDESYDANWPTTANMKADGTVELNVKEAVKWLFGLRVPSGAEQAPPSLASIRADVNKGLVAFGPSSGGHNAYMLAATGVAGVRAFDCAIGWSGGPDALLSDNTATQIAAYMNTTQPHNASDMTDKFKFADLTNRLSTVPNKCPIYIAGNESESVNPANIDQYYADHKAQQAIWIRHIDTSKSTQLKADGSKINVGAHAANYEDWVLRPTDPKVISPSGISPMVGISIFTDSIRFARAQLPAQGGNVTLQNTLTDPEGHPIIGARVVIRLLPADAETGRPATSASPFDAVVASTDSTGTWTASLPRNTDLLPPGSQYLVIEYQPHRGAPIVTTISIPAIGQSPFWLRDLKVA